MDKLNNYIPVPLPQPLIVKLPCSTPACAEVNRKYEEAIKKQPQSQPTSHSNFQQNQR
jgi:hypothetical protein